MQETAEEILAELREYPPLPGFERAEIPGERERDRRAANEDKPLQLSAASRTEIENLIDKLSVTILDTEECDE